MPLGDSIGESRNQQCLVISVKEDLFVISVELLYVSNPAANLVCCEDLTERSLICCVYIAVTWASGSTSGFRNSLKLLKSAGGLVMMRQDKDVYSCTVLQRVAATTQFLMSL